MNTTQVCSTILLSLALLGCHGRAGKITSTPKENFCNFSSMSGKSYKIADRFKPYITNSFFHDADDEKYKQLDKSDYQSLISQKFKVMETGIITAEDKKSRQPYLESYRYREEVIDGELYKRDKAFSTKLVTEDCTEYYLSGGTTKSSIITDIQNADGSNIDDKDVFQLIGVKPLQKVDLEAELKFDKFEKTYKISTPFFREQLIRGAVKVKTNEVFAVQLYTSLKFLGSWGNIQSAIDLDGNRHEVTKISHDSDCSSRISGCILTETIGISLTPEFLEKNKEGFEIKASGTQERVISVPGKLVKSFLIGLNKAKNIMQ